MVRLVLLVLAAAVEVAAIVKLLLVELQILVAAVEVQMQLL
jgi:hypothetical protein